MLNNNNKQKFKQHYFYTKGDAGFTLIELIISIAVFTIGLMASFGLALSNYNTSNDSLDRVVATNLAREGIELIRNVRDSNWLRIEANEDADGVVGDPFVPYTWDYGLDTSPIYIDYNDCADACDGVELYKNVNGYYTHDATTVGNVLTKYSRYMILEKICLDESSVPDPATDESIMMIGLDCEDLINHIQIGLKVTAHVGWEDNGTRYIEIVDKIYNWRR